MGGESLGTNYDFPEPRPPLSLKLEVREERGYVLSPGVMTPLGHLLLIPSSWKLASLPYPTPLAGCKSAPFAAACSPVTCSVLLPGPHPRPPVIAPPTGRAGAYIQTTPRALCPASHSGLTPRGRPVRPHPVSVLSAFPAQRGPVWSHPCSSERIITASFPLGPLLQTAPPIHLHKT